MPTQFDFNPGLDLSSLTSATLAQVVQAISQIAPLSNIGGIYVGTTRPDITNNARFIRYLWLDITTPSNPAIKRYIGNRTSLEDADNKWTAIGVATNAITTLMIDDIASRTVDDANGGVDIGRLKLNADGTATAGDIGKLLRIEANGRYVEVVALANILTNGVVPLTALSATGGTNYYILSVSGGAISWTPFNPTNMILAGYEIPIGKLLVAAPDAYKIPVVNSTGTALAYEYQKTLQRVRTYLTAATQTLTTVVTTATALTMTSGTAIAGLSTVITPRSTTSLLRCRAFVQGFFSAAGTVNSLVGIFTNGTYFSYGGAHGSVTAQVFSMIYEAVLKPISGVQTINLNMALSSTGNLYVNKLDATTAIYASTSVDSPGTPVGCWLEVEEIDA